MADKLKGRKTLQVGGILEEFEKDKIKDQVDIISLFSSFGVQLTHKGSSFVGRCPWHEDSTPSLSVSREKGVYNCFGCGESGDVFTLVQKMKGTDFKGALAFLKSANGSVSRPVGQGEPVRSAPAAAPEQSGQTPPAASPAPQPEPPKESGVSLDDLITHWQGVFQGSPKAHEYLEGRELTRRELYNRFRIGYSDGTLTEKLSDNQAEQLINIGVLNKSGNEVFTDHIIIPLFNPEGEECVGVYGRQINEGDGTGGPIHLYLKGPHQGLFNAKAAKVYREEIILTESVIDALSLIHLRIENVIPCYGTNGCADIHLKFLKDERVQTVVIAFDNDQPGQAAASKLNERLVSEGFSVKTIVPPVGKDWNEYLIGGGTKDEVTTLCEKAQTAVAEEQHESFQVSTTGLEYRFETSDVIYHVVGVKEAFVSSLRVNIKVEHEGVLFPDTVDLYSARSRSSFSSLISSRMNIGESRLEADLLKILSHLEGVRDKELETSVPKTYTMSEEEKRLGMALLKSDDLIGQIIHDTATLGYVGDDINKLLVYLAASSRKLEDPISVMVVSESASGKSYLAETITRLMPEEDVVTITSVSDQAFNYLAEDGLLHKFLVMGEAVHNEVIEHQIREMLSAKELSRLVTTKDQKTGTMSSKLVRKRAIVSAVMSTTNYHVNPENASRFFVINTNESEEQTKAIHERQRLKYSLSRIKEKEERIPQIVAKHQAAQRLLKPVKIVNPFAPLLDFPSKLMRSRRDHERFIDLIACVCFLRQYQKEETEAEGFRFIECDLDDYTIAYSVMTQVLPATLSSFPKAAMSLYDAIRAYVTKRSREEQVAVTQVTCTQRELREHTEYTQRFIKRYMAVLCEYEYLKRGGLGVRGSRNSYTLVTDASVHAVDLSAIPSPQSMGMKLKNIQSGPSGP